MNDATSLGMPIQLLTGLGLLVLTATALYGWRQRRPMLRRAAIAVGAVWLAGYGATLAAVSLTSHDVTLAPGSWKHFCGLYLDCHGMVTVSRVDTRPTIGDVAAEGTFYVVTLRQSSSARRARIGIPHAASVVVDAAGRRYPPSTLGQQALERLEGAQPELGRPVDPNAGYETKVVFDLPQRVAEPRLLVQSRDPVDTVVELFLIGDEDSLWHKRVLFALTPTGNG